MKKDRLHTELNAWLKAEATGDDAGAEAAFGALVGSLPRMGPSPGFAERVVWAAVPAPATAHPAWVVWLTRGALAAALALAALATGLLPAAVRALPALPSPGQIAKGLADGLAWIGRRFEDGVAVWEFLGRIGEAMSLALGTPQAQAAVAGSAILSVIAFYTLHHLLTFERRTVR
ncbi:MAG: hypothetical protein R3326_05435 [Gemmatimonadota bacterium]|nr:hypothetical protein [Gemmatimonadota bacterium]